MALGSTLDNIITSPNVDLATMLAALAVLVGVQYAISRGMAHSPRFERWANGRPTLLLYRGQCIFPVVTEMRVT